MPGLGFQGLDSLARIPGFGFPGLYSCLWIPGLGFLRLDSWVWITGFGFLGWDLDSWGRRPGFECLGLYWWVELLHCSASILNERCEYYENNLSFYSEFLKIPLTNCDTVERDFGILLDVSCESPTFSKRSPRSPRPHLQKSSKTT